MQVIEQHKNKFTTDFAENKKILDQLVVLRSKALMNEVAGYITKYLKREADTKEAKQEEEAEVDTEEVEEETEQVEQETDEESAPQEILVENQSQESS